MICRARPYEGELPYIFFSYCHLDADSVYPIIESMAERGYRIWYDDGIHPGDDWIETIAMHISGCSVCIAAVTSRSVVSHNCRNEVNFSIEHKKPLIPIILEEFPMTLGVHLQLSSRQHIRKYELPNELEFFKKLFSADELTQCKGDRSLLESESFAQIELETMEKERERSLQKRAAQLKRASDALRPNRVIWNVHSRSESEASLQDILEEEDDSVVVGRQDPSTAAGQKTSGQKRTSEASGRYRILGKRATEKRSAVRKRHRKSELKEEGRQAGASAVEQQDTTGEKFPARGDLQRRSGQIHQEEKKQSRQGALPFREDTYDQDDPDKTELESPEEMFGSYDEDDPDKTELETSEDLYGGEDDEATLMDGFDQTFSGGRLGRREKPSVKRAALVYLDSARIFPIQKAITKIGRDIGKCDIVLRDYAVSSIHAEIVNNRQGFYLRDMDSTNGTVLNGTIMSGLEPVRLEDTASILFAEEFCLFVADKTAETILSRKWIAILKCVETDEIMPLLRESLDLGRANVWPDGTFSDRHASRHHGMIRYENGRYILAIDTESTNGTFLNEERLFKGTEVELYENDEIRTGSVYHIRFHYIDLKIGGQPE